MRKFQLPIGLTFVYTKVMNEASVSFKRKTGRPRVGAKLVGVSLPPQPLAALDAWIAARPEPRPSRPEAIRQLLEKALASPK
jgi:hypothetical protein